MMAHRAFIVVLTLLAAATGAAAPRVDQAVAMSPAAATPPVTLAAGSSGSTTLGASATSATTTVALPLFGSTQALRVLRGPASWDVHLEALGASGFGVLDSTTVTLAGASSTTQVVVTLGILTQTSGPALTLPPGGPDLQIRASGSVVGAGTLDLRIVIVPTGQTAPIVEYPYTLTVT